MVSLEDWASMDETAYLMASPANKSALMRALAEAEDGKGVTLTMAEFEALAKA